MSEKDTIRGAILGHLDAYKSGNLPGFTTGFDRLDRLTGRLQSGQVWVVGGASGVGKSFFVNNMIEGLIKAKKQGKVLVFSTELSKQTYIFRHILMRAGVYKRQAEEHPADYYDRIDVEILKFSADMTSWNNDIRFYGGLSSFEEIEALLAAERPQVFFIDYIQELSYDKNTESKLVMPLVAARLKAICLEWGMTAVVVSQVNNQSLNSKFSSQAAPFDYGKELNRVAHTSLVLKRKRFGNGKLSRALEVEVFKARDGETGIVQFEILPGYKLKQIDNIRVMELEDEG